MQDFIRFLESHNELKIIDTPLDIELEIPHLAYLEVKKKDLKPCFSLVPYIENIRILILVMLSKAKLLKIVNFKPCHTEPLGEVSNTEILKRYFAFS